MEAVNHEYYVSFEVAKILKKAGFDWKCKTCYIGKSKYPYNFQKFFNWNIPRKYFEIDGSDNIFHKFINLKNNSSFSSAPTFEVVQRWLREVKNCYVSIVADCDSVGVFYTVSYIFYEGDNYNALHIWEKDEHEKDNHHRLKIFKTYEEAQEAGIKKVLEIILKK